MFNEGRGTDTKKLAVAFRNFVNAPKNEDDGPHTEVSSD